MPIFQSVEATVEGASIRVRLCLDKPRALAWQVLDPVTGALLSDGRSSGKHDGEGTESDAAIQVLIPPEDGPYRVQVSPEEDRDRVVLIDASMEDGRLEIEPSRTVSLAALRRARFFRAIPKAFLYPVRSVWTNRKLMASMVRRDILARSRGSFGGAFWTFLNPLLLMATYFFVFGVVLQQKFGADSSRTAYVLYFLAGMLPWLPFAEAVGRSPYIIIEHRSFVKKLVFPLETLPVNLVLSGLVTEVFALAIFFVSLLAIRRAAPVSVLWLPVLLVPQMLLAAGLCWFLAALGVFVRDLGQIIGFLLTVWFFMTPICYVESQAVPAWAARILEFNPILVLVRGYRAILLENRAPAAEPLMWLWLAAGLIAVLGHAWFHGLRRSFADVI
jgi:lipopolysaccharide transport system permease protein